MSKIRHFHLLIPCMGLSALFAASVPAAALAFKEPAGIVCLVNLNLTPAQLAADPGWTNPNVKGFIVREGWSTFEPSQNVMNFSLFDEAVLLAQANGKFVGLSVGAGLLAPSWIYTAGATPFPYTPPGAPRPLFNIPTPWDTVFQGLWGNVISAIGQRYDGNPVVAYIVMTGPGRSFETTFVDNPNDVKLFNAEGGPTLWVPASTAIADIYAASFPSTAILYSLGVPVPGTPGTTMTASLANGLAAKYPEEFGVDTASLSPGTKAGGTTAVTFIQQQTTHTTVGFQMVSNAAAFTKGTTLAQALTVGINLGAHYIEVYSVDCSNSKQQSVLAQANTGLLANAAKQH